MLKEGGDIEMDTEVQVDDVQEEIVEKEEVIVKASIVEETPVKEETPKYKSALDELDNLNIFQSG